MIIYIYNYTGVINPILPYVLMALTSKATVLPREKSGRNEFHHLTQWWAYIKVVLWVSWSPRYVVVLLGSRKTE